MFHYRELQKIYFTLTVGYYKIIFDILENGNSKHDTQSPRQHQRTEFKSQNNGEFNYSVIIRAPDFNGDSDRQRVRQKLHLKLLLQCDAVFVDNRNR